MGRVWGAEGGRVWGGGGGGGGYVLKRNTKNLKSVHQITSVDDFFRCNFVHLLGPQN